jgi:hypothetical protein
MTNETEYSDRAKRVLLQGTEMEEWLKKNAPRIIQAALDTAEWRTMRDFDIKGIWLRDLTALPPIWVTCDSRTARSGYVIHQIRWHNPNPQESSESYNLIHYGGFEEEPDDIDHSLWMVLADLVNPDEIGTWNPTKASNEFWSAIIAHPDTTAALKGRWLRGEQLADLL